MKLVHVVTLASEEAAFGGPMRVALNQVAELRRRGHDAVVAAGWRGRSDPPTKIDGVPVQLFKARQIIPGGGFSGLVCPELGRWIKTMRTSFDLAHVHSGRDLTSLQAMRAARTAKLPYVTQTHGMIRLDRRVRVRVVDKLATRRELGGAARQLVLTDDEVVDLLRLLGSRAALHRVRNGVALPEVADAAGVEVLYCARIHSRKRPAAFVAMAAILRQRSVQAKFSIIGPDEGELPALLAQIESSGLREVVSYQGALPYGLVLDRMRQAAIYVLPSVAEPFPMTLLEAMSLGIACVCTDTVGISGELHRAGAALVTDGSPEQMANAVQALLSDPVARTELGARGRDIVRRLYSIEAIVGDLEKLYVAVIAEQGSRGR